MNRNKPTIKLEIKEATTENLFMEFLNSARKDGLTEHQVYLDKNKNLKVHYFPTQEFSFDFNQKGNLVRIVHYKD